MRTGSPGSPNERSFPPGNGGFASEAGHRNTAFPRARFHLSCPIRKFRSLVLPLQKNSNKSDHGASVKKVRSSFFHKTVPMGSIAVSAMQLHKALSKPRITRFIHQPSSSSLTKLPSSHFTAKFLICQTILLCGCAKKWPDQPIRQHQK